MYTYIYSRITQTSRKSVRLDWDNFWWAERVIRNTLSRALKHDWLLDDEVKTWLSWLFDQSWEPEMKKSPKVEETVTDSHLFRECNTKERTFVFFSWTETFSSRSFFWGFVDHFIRNNVFDQMRWNIGSRKSDPLNPPNNDRKKGRKNWRIAFEKGLLSQKCERKLETLSFSWVCNSFKYILILAIVNVVSLQKE